MVRRRIETRRDKKDEELELTPNEEQDEKAEEGRRSTKMAK